MKTQRKSRIVEDSIESKRGLGDESQMNSLRRLPVDSIKNLWEQLLKPAVSKNAPEQLFGVGKEDVSKKRKDIDLIEGKEFVLKEESEEESQEFTEVIQTKEHMDYFREIKSSEVTVAKKLERNEEERCAEIMLELRRLAKTSKTLEREVKTIVMEIPPAQTGKYHSNFLEWLLISLKKARERLDEGAAWARMFSSKKTQKQYWNMAKKHNTTFTLSGERTVATQTA